MNQDTFRNPILPGFYPDPSICAANGKYYIVTSSFYYFPGLPVFESEDLVHWRQIGNAIDRPDQLDYRDCENSEGLWAPTIRYHEGRFYIVNTLDVNGRTHRYNYVIWAEDPAGPWSDAVVIDGADGIDPSLFFDDEGRVWLCYNHVPERTAYPEHKQIILRELDRETWQFAGPEHIIWDAVKDYSLYNLREGVGMVLQKNVLFSGTIAENLRWGDENAAEEEMIAAATSSQADKFISTFADGYDTELDKGGNNLSGGQKQRLCIARALLKKPKILILDDSTSAVDTATEAQIRHAFTHELAGSTKIIIAQRIASVMDADQIIVMNEGKITGIGTHDELLASNTEYREIAESQLGKKGA